MDTKTQRRRGLAVLLSVLFATALVVALVVPLFVASASAPGIISPYVPASSLLPAALDNSACWKTITSPPGHPRSPKRRPSHA
jgi:hypothetical protein